MTHTRYLPFAATLVAIAALLAGCSASATPTDPASSAPSAVDVDWSSATLAELAALNPTELVESLEALPTAERPTDLRVSVRPDNLIITTLAGEESVALSDDLFYLSVAPYIASTHECFFHSLTTCHGELGGKEITVTVTASDGEVLIDGTRIAADNGFVGLWLPRDITGTLTVSTDGKTATTAFSTGPADPTCVTTLHLS